MLSLRQLYSALSAMIVDFFSYESLKSLFLILLCIASFETFILEPYRIPSPSMKPTLSIGDHIFVSKFSYGYGAYILPFSLPRIPFIKERFFATNMPKRGDIAIFRGTQSDTQGITFIKRVIGLPGDKIQILNGQLYINGTPTKLTKLKDIHDADSNSILTEFIEEIPSGFSYHIFVDQDRALREPQNNTKLYIIPPGNYFCMGDNRDHSGDSRFPKMGFIPAQNLIGRAYFLYWNSYDFWQSVKSLELQRLFTVFKYAA